MIILEQQDEEQHGISGTKWDEELPDGFYSASDIQDYFKYTFIKKHETLLDKSPVQIYVNKIMNRIMFKIKTEYYLELLTL